MADIPTSTPMPKIGSASSAEAIEAARRNAEATRQQIDRNTDDAEKVVETAADAGLDAGRAQREILQRNTETAYEAVPSGLETGAQALQAMTQGVSQAFGMMRADPDVAEQSARNVRAVAEATSALTRGTEEASRAWFDHVQNGVRANLDLLGEFTNCRSLQDFTALQSRLVRDNLQRFIETGQKIAQASAQATAEASRAIHSAPVGAPAIA